MTLQFYNTLTKQKEEFTPQAKRRVTMYTCGPTVYSHPHIGNFRSFMAADILRRYLEYLGYEVFHVVNITDVGHMTTDDEAAQSQPGEDKIQAAAAREKKTPQEITRFYEQEFMEVSKLLNLRPAQAYPRATEHIQEMIDLIQQLLKKGYAYEVNGNIYYEIAKFKAYGQLSGNTLENLMAGARVEVSQEKRSPFDFALWKQDPKHLMQWDSPWGKGFPGWHIECSAMSMKYLGQTFDIHTGGEDNLFPHHESEIAQSEAATGQPFVRYWFHPRYLLVDNQKMSKSLGNFYTVHDVLKKGYAPMALRYALMNTHYRQNVNFTMESLEAARNAVQRLLDFQQRLQEISHQDQPKDSSGKVDKILSSTQHRFEAAMSDDLNISEALAAIFDMVRAINKIGLSSQEAEQVLQFLKRFDTVLGILEPKDKVLDQDIEALIKARQEARQNKDYQKADAIRTQLKKQGIILEDTAQGVRWKRTL